MSVNLRILCVVIAALALASGVGTALGDDSGATPAPATSCTNQQSPQLGDDEEQAADDVSQAASDVEQEASSRQPDDEAGDAQGSQAQQGSQADDDECDDEGTDTQGNDDGGD